MSKQASANPQGNPQGKGLVPVLEHWQNARPVAVTAKPAAQILADYFTTLLVLSARFSFKPVPGTNYFLYLCEDGWRLSLISAQEWGARLPGRYVGSCQLRLDMTWQLALGENLAQDETIAAALQAFQDGFLELLSTDSPLEDKLPYYVKSLPFYPRLLASGLSSSLKQSMQLSGLCARSGQQWLQSAEARGAINYLPEPTKTGLAVAN